MNIYAIYDRFTGEVLHLAVCPGPFQASEDFIEALVDTGNLDRVAFAKVDGRSGIPRVVNIHDPSPAAAPEPPTVPQGRIDFERTA